MVEAAGGTDREGQVCKCAHKDGHKSRQPPRMEQGDTRAFWRAGVPAKAVGGLLLADRGAGADVRRARHRPLLAQGRAAPGVGVCT